MNISRKFKIEELNMIEGQCLCGLVSYRYHACIESSLLCYCLHCKRAQGSLMGWNSAIDQSKFEVIRGLKYLKKYFHSPNKARVFCQECGSPIYSYRIDLPNIIRLRLGTVTAGHLPAPKEEFFLEHKADFLTICVNQE